MKRYLLTFGKARLEQSGKRLSDGTKSRKKTGNAWYEMQDTCAYHADFRKEKLFWMQMTDQGRFAYSADEMFGNAKVFIVTGESLKYLCGVLNSRLPAWFMSKTGVTTGMGLMQWQGVTVQRIPIPRISLELQRPFVGLVNQILEAKAVNPRADTSALEAEVDRLVFALYGLTEEEVVVAEELEG